MGWDSRAERLIKANPAIVNKIDPKYGPPLAHALWSDQVGIAKLLIENGADIDVRFHGMTAENIAVGKKQEEILDLIHEVRINRELVESGSREGESVESESNH